jgi:gamma-glutamylcyclotransferase (GGCT)/AIG2-like uncharacterized protein YtfP
MKYFAYGMNTNRVEMFIRCPNARSLGAATLPYHEFRFARHADVLESRTSIVDGVLWEITDLCLKSLDILEGYPYYYNRKTAIVEHNGQEIDAMVYYMIGNQVDSPPSESYLRMLYDGYKVHGLSVKQIHDAINFSINYDYNTVNENEIF